METKIKLILMAIVMFVIGTTVITTQVTGTDSGSTLIQDLGPLALAFVVLMTFLGGIMLSRRGG